MIKTIALLGILAAVQTSCQHTAATVISDFCHSYTIIRPSRSDTPETLRQIAAANAKYRSVCEAEKK